MNLKLTKVNEESISAYPYVTEFKQKPFRSFTFARKEDINIFFIPEYDKIIKIYRHFEQGLLKINKLNLENIYWFLLLGKFLNEDIATTKDEIIKFVSKCEIRSSDSLGFKFAPDVDQKKPDIWSTFFAIAIFNLLGFLKSYLYTGPVEKSKEKIVNFILNSREKGNFQHCTNKNCAICLKTTPIRTNYFALELLVLLNVDINLKQNLFLKNYEELKKAYSIVFKLLGLKYFGLNSDVESKHLKYLHQFQQSDGGFNFQNKTAGDINQTFWITFVLENYSWLLDYNRGNVYSFLIKSLKDISPDLEIITTLKLMEISKILMTFSFIWPKFIGEVERTIFKNLEDNSVVDLSLIKKELGIKEGLQEIIRYLNQTYVFDLEILDNSIEFTNYLRTLNPEMAYLAKLIHDKVKDNNIVFLNKVFQDFTYKYPLSTIKIKQIDPIIDQLTSKNFFKGRKDKRTILFVIKKYYFIRDSFITHVLTTNSSIDYEEICNEKAKIEDVKNNIFNIIRKLKETPEKVKEEVKSLILVGDINYAKDRLKYNIKSILMEADFLNENIENSFSEEFRFINPSAVLSNEISDWNKTYFNIRENYKNLQLFFSELFKEKEDLKNFRAIVEELKEKIEINEQKIYSLIDNFKNSFRESLERSYSEDIVKNLLNSCEELNSKIKSLDGQIYSLSQRITSKEKSILKSLKKIVSKWISIKEVADEFIDFYLEGFTIYEDHKKSMNELTENTSKMIESLKNDVSLILKDKMFQKALEIIEKQTEGHLNQQMEAIKNSLAYLKEQIKGKRKLFLLLKNIQEDWNRLEQTMISDINEYKGSIEENVIEQRDLDKLKTFDKLIEENISLLKMELKQKEEDIEKNLSIKNLTLPDLTSKIDGLLEKYNHLNDNIKKRLNNTSKTIPNFRDISRLCHMTWEKFGETFEISLGDIQNKFTNDIIKQEIMSRSTDSKTNLLKLEELKKKLKIKCNVLIERISEMIDIAKLDGELNEKKRELTVHTESFYKNKKLKNLIERQLERVGVEFAKVGALYESAVKNRTFTVNLLEIQNRIDDFTARLQTLNNQYHQEIVKLEIDKSREEFRINQEFLATNVEKYNAIIKDISENIRNFDQINSFIGEEFSTLKLRLDKLNKSIQEELEKEEAYDKSKVAVQAKLNNFSGSLSLAQNKTEEKIGSLLFQNEKIRILGREIREIFVEKKREFTKIYDEFKDNISKNLNNINNDTLRSRLLNFISKRQISLNQMLGTLERKVEDKIEIKEFKSTNAMVQKRVKKIGEKLKEIDNEASQIKKKFKKESTDFDTKNKFIFADFKQFINEYKDILDEKTKSLERLILKGYIELVIKAVKDEYLTLAFLSKELKFKRDKLQTHIITLIGSNDLPGKYDPELQIYYENAEIIENLDPAKLRVIKTTNFKLYEFLNRMKFFTREYYSIVAFIAAIFTITYYIFVLSGGSPYAVIVPLGMLIVIVGYILLRKQQKEKI